MSKPNRIEAAPWLAADLEDLYRDPVFLAEDLILGIMEQVHDAIKAQGLRQKDLADRLGKSPSAISQMLSGDQNISLRRLTELALALGLRVAPITLVPLSPPEIPEVDNSGDASSQVTSVHPVPPSAAS